MQPTQCPVPLLEASHADCDSLTGDENPLLPCFPASLFQVREKMTIILLLLLSEANYSGLYYKTNWLDLGSSHLTGKGGRP